MAERRIETDLRLEVERKLIHLFALLIPVVYYLTDRGFVLVALAVLTAVAVGIEVGRRQPRVDTAFVTLFGRWLREGERPGGGRLTAATWQVAGALASVVLLPRYAAILALAVYVTGDAAAALVGRRFGRHKVGERSLEGTAAFLAAGLAVVLLTPRLGPDVGEYGLCVAAVVVGALVELLLPPALNDNLVVPLAIGATVWAGYALSYPAVPLTVYGP